jgi:2-oxoisovalerate dehydrogenase E1 component alpha subunit
VPHAVGIALAGKMEGKDLLTFVTFGEGSSNQGDFHEGANFAGVHKLPVIFMCENNKYAISVPIEKQLACENVSDRAIGCGMPGYTVDGNDPLEVYKVVKEAATRARSGKGPTLVETVSYRLTPHSSDDDDRSYRAPDEVAKAKTLDPIITFGAYLKETGVMSDDLEKEINDRVMKIVNEATDYAENAPYSPGEDALKYVYAEK